MADRYWVGGTGTWNSSSTTNWSASSGGAGGASVPTSTDNAIFDASSGGGTCTMSGTIACANLVMTGYTGTLAGSGTLTSSGTAVALDTGVTYTTTATLNIATTATLTSNGKTWSGALTLSGGSTTKTLADNWNVSGLVTLSGTSMVMNGFQISCNGGLTLTANLSAGTTKVVLKSGTWTGNATFPYDFDIDGGSNTITGSGSLQWGGASKTFNYVSGFVDMTGTTLALANAACSFNTNGSAQDKTGRVNGAGINFNNVSCNTGTYTLSSPLTIQGTLTTSSAIFNGSFIYVNGAVSMSGNSSGTSTLVTSGECVISMTSAANGNAMNWTIRDRTTISGLVNYSTNTLTIDTYQLKWATSGTQVGLLALTGNSTLLGADKNYMNVRISAGSTITMNRMFMGSPRRRSTIVSNTTSNYTLAFQDGFEKLGNNLRISNCTASRFGQILLDDGSNEGSNSGIRYYNQFPNFIAKNQQPTQMMPPSMFIEYSPYANK